MSRYTAPIKAGSSKYRVLKNKSPQAATDFLGHIEDILEWHGVDSLDQLHSILTNVNASLIEVNVYKTALELALTQPIDKIRLARCENNLLLYYLTQAKNIIGGL